METLDKETQLVAVEKVLEEMRKAEEYVKGWNATWWEQLQDAYCLPLHYEIGEMDVREMEDRYRGRYRLPNAFYSGESIGVPLVKETLVGNNTLRGERNKEFECEFGRVDWYGMVSHNSKRVFSFHNDGEIYFSKEGIRRRTKKHPRRTSYEATFNVLSDDFHLDITLGELTEYCTFQYHYITISLCGNILTKKWNDIEVTEDLSTGMKSVKIEKKYDERNCQNNASIAFEAVLNPDNSLEMGAVAISTHKANGKVNGTYRFDVSRKKGIRANFYSRKGIKVDLTTNPMLLETANGLLLPTPNHQDSSDIVVSNFASSAQNAIAKNLSQRVITFDSSDFHMEAIKETESLVINMLKTIRGELPLSGLVERIDNCLELIDRENNLETPESVKTLKLKAKN